MYSKKHITATQVQPYCRIDHISLLSLQTSSCFPDILHPTSFPILLFSRCLFYYKDIWRYLIVGDDCNSRNPASEFRFFAKQNVKWTLVNWEKRIGELEKVRMTSLSPEVSSIFWRVGSRRITGWSRTGIVSTSLIFAILSPTLQMLVRQSRLSTLLS